MDGEGVKAAQHKIQHSAHSFSHVLVLGFLR